MLNLPGSAEDFKISKKTKERDLELLHSNSIENLRSVSNRSHCDRGHKASHILTLYLNNAIDLLASLELVHYEVPLPTCL